MSAATPAPDDDPLAVTLRYSPHSPEPPQQAFLLLDELGVLEAFYGGAGGGGKSDALLMAALRYVHVPNYAAILFRRTFADLALPGALMDRGNEWLAGTDARFNKTESRWRFPSGASLSFGYLQHSRDRFNYASAEFQFIGFDELTGFLEADYRFLFTRLRRPSGLSDNDPLAAVPLRMRSASNPGNRGHDWVKRRFIERKPDPDDPKDSEEKARGRIFIPARLADNPHLDQASYIESLDQVDPHTRAQMLDGDWDAREPGDWVYDSTALRAVTNLGERYDELLAAGAMTPPRGELLAHGIDWGEHTAILIGWPLERGGMYVVAECILEGLEPAAAAEEAIAELERVVRLGRQPAPTPPSSAIKRGRQPKPLRRVGALYPRGDALRLVEDHRYDAAGASSMRTYMKAVRRRHSTARSTKVPFGAPAPRSGASSGGRTYKAETIGYIRRLLERTLADTFPSLAAYVDHVAERDDRDWNAERRRREVARLARAGELAISPARCPELVRQASRLKWRDRDAGQVVKGDDHAPDALIALEAPDAIRHR